MNLIYALTITVATSFDQQLFSMNQNQQRFSATKYVILTNQNPQNKIKPTNPNQQMTPIQQQQYNNLTAQTCLSHAQIGNTYAFNQPGAAPHIQAAIAQHNFNQAYNKK